MRGNLQTFLWLGERFLSSSSFSIAPFLEWLDHFEGQFLEE